MNGDSPYDPRIITRENIFKGQEIQKDFISEIRKKSKKNVEEYKRITECDEYELYPREELEKKKIIKDEIIKKVIKNVAPENVLTFLINYISQRNEFYYYALVHVKEIVSDASLSLPNITQKNIEMILTLINEEKNDQCRIEAIIILNNLIHRTDLFSKYALNSNCIKLLLHVKSQNSDVQCYVIINRF